MTYNSFTFPLVIPPKLNQVTNEPEKGQIQRGITLRDYAVIQFLSGIIPPYANTPEEIQADIKSAFEYADAFLAFRQSNPPANPAKVRLKQLEMQYPSPKKQAE